MYRNLPWLFNWGYGFTERHTDIFKERKMVYNFFGKGADDLYAYIVRGAFDTIICTHPFASLMLTETQRRHHLPIKTAFVATDYTCSPSVKDSDLDYYFIPMERLAREFECPNIPKEKIIASGIPIRQMFYDHTEKEKAKQALGIEPDHKHMVMMCGSMGCGPIGKLAGMLAAQLQEGFDLTVVCGTNDKLKAQLEHKYGSCKSLHICGYVKNVSALLDSADLYVTKAGGISVTEAAAKALPMVYIKAVAGCEDYNSRLYADIGGAKMASNGSDLTRICVQLLTDTSRYEQMKNSLAGVNGCNASVCIYNTLSMS